MTEKPGSGAALPIALAALGTALAAGAALVLGSGGQTRPTPAKFHREAEPRDAKLEWFGGVTRFNIDALAFLFASENEDASFLVWALQGLAANNFARQLGRTRPKIKSIGDMLQSGFDKKLKKRFYDLGWGPQYDRATNITRWGATSAGRRPLTVSWRYFEMAERLLLNKINFDELRGRRGESMPARHEWLRINSFVQYERFGETVIRQAGPEAEIDLSKVVKEWKPRLVIQAEGLNFYATGGH